MKTLNKIVVAIAFIAFSASCQFTTDTKKVLSNKDTRKEIIETISNNIELSNEMMEAMRNGKNSHIFTFRNEKMEMIMGIQDTRMQMLKDDQGKMQMMPN